MADPAQLLAHERNLEEMTNIIQCDALIFQTLQDLKDACVEAADKGCPVKDFEVGVFCGNYKSPVPDDYFERSSRMYNNKNLKRKATEVTEEEGDAGGVIVPASSGPVNGTNGAQEDLRYVLRWDGAQC